MRKLWIWAAMMLLLVTVARAHEEVNQAPIIALVGNALYAVSPEDGTATLVVQPSEEDTISRLDAGCVAPNGQWMAYILASANGPSDPSYSAQLRLLYLSDLLTDDITPRGGVFDRPVPKNHVIQLEYPTWSADGARLYYVRTERETRAEGKAVDVQLGYYDPVARTHRLAARLDPTNLLENLQAVEGGMIVRWYKPGFDSPTFSTFYTLDNRANRPMEVGNAYLYALHGEDGAYHYAQLNDFGDIRTLVNIQTGDEKPAEMGFYPAAQSLNNGEHSLHVFSVQSEFSTFYVYGQGELKGGTSIDNISGFNYALSPDGQQMAFLQFDGSSQEPIQILNMKGEVRKLDFKAEQLLWGAVEFTAFPAPG